MPCAFAGIASVRATTASIRGNSWCWPLEYWVPIPRSRVLEQELGPDWSNAFDSFDQCRDHCGVHEGPRVVQVIEIGSGACVETYRWYGGGWRYHAGDDWND